MTISTSYIRWRYGIRRNGSQPANRARLCTAASRMVKGDRQKKAAADLVLVTHEYTVNRNKRCTVSPSRSARRAPSASSASLGADDEDEGRAPRHQA